MKKYKNRTLADSIYDLRVRKIKKIVFFKKKEPLEEYSEIGELKKCIPRT